MVKQKKYKQVHIVPTKAGIDFQKMNDWNYIVRAERMDGCMIGKIYRSRNAAARFGNTIAKKVVHWYNY